MRIDFKQLLENYFSLVKKFVPEQIVRPSVGIDIGHHSIKLVAVKPQGNTHELIHYAVEPDVANPVEAIRSLLKNLPEPPISLTTSVSGKGTLVRYIDMPRMNADDLKKSFALEADKYFPFPKDQIYHDCFILDKGERDNKMPVMVAAAKKELVDQRVALFKDLELQPDYIVLDSIAMANAFHVLGETATAEDASSSPQATAILDIGQRVSNLTILAGRMPRFCRDIFIGGHEMTCSISNGFGISLEEAEKIKLKPGNKQAEILKFTDSIIMNLVSELRLSFDYFITEKNIPISRLWLTGGGSHLAGLPDVFGKALEVEVGQWDMLGQMRVAPEIAEDEIKKVAGTLGVATGMALYR